MNSPIVRLLKVVGLGALVLAAVVGSIWLAQADLLMTAHPPRNLYPLPTSTLFPTLSPSTPTTPASAAPEPEVETETPLVPSPSSTPMPQATACKPPAGWVEYTVVVGDTIYELARQGQTNLQALLQGNCLAAARDLVAGEVLYLPSIARATPTLVVASCGPPAGWPIVIVKPQETLYALAVRYGTTVPALRQANCLTGDLVKAGDPLYVPPHIVVPPTPPSTIVWWTPTPTLQPTVPPTPSPSATLPTTPTATPTATPEPSPTSTPTETPVLVPTWTPPVWPLPTETETPTLTPSPTPTLPLPTATSTP